MMLAREACVALLLGAAVAAAWLSAMGVLLMRGAFARLHYVGIASLLLPMLVALAILLDGSSLQSSIKAVLVLMILIFTTPAVTHATARAVYLREARETRPSQAAGQASENEGRVP